MSRQIKMIRSVDEFNDYIDVLDDNPIFFDTETIGLYGFIRLFQFYQQWSDTVAVIDGYFIQKEVIEWLKTTDKIIVGYNLPYDFGCMGFTTKNYHDLFAAVKIAYPKFEKYSLDAVLEQFGQVISSDKKAMQKADWSGVITNDMIKYASEDVIFLENLYQDERVQEAFNSFVYKLDMLALKYAIDAQHTGLKVNKEKHKAKLAETIDKLAELKRVIPINYDSPKQVTEFLGTKKADKETLKDLMYSGNKDAENIFYAKKYSKELSFLLKYNKERVYGHFNPYAAVSGRFNCSQENLQQIPRDLKNVFGFTESEDRVFVSADYPQIELRLAVCIWGEPTMEKLFKDGEDLHIATASSIFGRPKEEITKQERQIAKSANFGLLYGMGIERFRKYVRTNTGIDLTYEEAKLAREKWFSLYIGFWQKHQEVAKEYRKQSGYLGYTACGRPYWGKTLSDSLNIQIQGSGAELIKLALHYLHKKLKDHNLQSVKVANIVHDAIVLESSIDEAKLASKLLNDSMLEAWQELGKTFPKCKDLPCPIDVEITKEYS